MGVGMPAAMHLEDFARKVREAFPESVWLFHVGSSLKRKRGWRDVDVRLMMDEADYEAYGFGDPRYAQTNPRWCAMCMAFSALGKQMTGLPIDFQIQQTSYANEKFPGAGNRSAIGHFHLIERDNG